MSALQDFKEECKTGGLYGEYDSHEQFRSSFSHHLTIELNKPKYKWITRPAVTVEPRDQELDENEIRLLEAAASDRNGQILTGSTMDGFYVQTNEENFVEEAPRSAAMWKRVVRRLAEMEYLDQLSDNIYEVTYEGFARADAELANLPLEVSASVSGPADKQMLSIRSSKPVTLNKIEFLTSSEARVSYVELDQRIGSRATIPLNQSKIVELNNVFRPDRSPHDHSGPAKLRLSLISRGHSFEAVLPVLLQPTFVNNQLWIELIGEKTFKLG